MESTCNVCTPLLMTKVAAPPKTETYAHEQWSKSLSYLNNIITALYNTVYITIAQHCMIYW